jgi:hypothetical protein
MENMLKRGLSSGALLAGVLILSPGLLLAGEQGASMRLYRDADSGVVGVPPPAAAQVAAPRALSAATTTESVSAAAEPAPQPVEAAAGGMRVGFDPRLRASVTRQAGTGPQHECVQAGGPTK